MAFNFNNFSTIPVLQQVSDHSITICSVDNYLEVKNNKRNIPKKTIFDYDKMDEERWTEFKNTMDALANSCELRLFQFNTKLNQTKLNFYWDLLQACIIKAADKIIPSHKSNG